MPRPRTGATADTPKVLSKALAILESFTAATPERSESQIARELGLSTSTTNRLLRGLAERAFLARLPDGRYCLGPTIVRIGRQAAASLDYARVFAPILEATARRTGETAMLAILVPGGLEARYVASVESPHRLRVTVAIGSSVPLTAGATAKALLAYCPPEVIDAALAVPRAPLADGTLLDPAVLRTELASIRERGWSRSWQETSDGAWAVAAPILDRTGQPIAAVGVATPTHRHTSASEAATATAVLDAARDATALVFGPPALGEAPEDA